MTTTFDAPWIRALIRGATSSPDHGTLFGQLFESLVTQSVRVYALPADATVHHLRLEDGRHEVDLIVQRHGIAVIPAALLTA